jgi:hypothetical protein
MSHVPAVVFHCGVKPEGVPTVCVEKSSANWPDAKVAPGIGAVPPAASTDMKSQYLGALLELKLP